MVRKRPYITRILALNFLTSILGELARRSPLNIARIFRMWRRANCVPYQLDV